MICVGTLVRLASHLDHYDFILDDQWQNTQTLFPLAIAKVNWYDVGIVVDDLSDENIFNEKVHHVLVLFNEKILRASTAMLKESK